MGLNNEINAEGVTASVFRLRWDLGLRMCNLPYGQTQWWSNVDGAAILRRWTGKKHPRPLAAPVVGMALGHESTTVASDSGAAWANDTVYWLCTDKVDGYGAYTAGRLDQARCAIWATGAYYGVVPNTPGHVTLRNAAGGKLALGWTYNPADEAIAPARFDVFSDGGTGTMNWTTPVANVTYRVGQKFYTYLTGALAPGSYRYNVRARSAAAKYSLVPDVGDGFIGGLGQVTSIGEVGPRREVITSTPATPAIPVAV